MFQNAFVLINLLAGLFAFSFLEDGVIIEDNTPTRLAPGESRMVEISINKGDVSGFAKLQLEIPAGLKAEAGDTHTASFTFAEGKAKFIWNSLPDEQIFTVSYKLTALPNSSGNKVINGAFSYIKANQRVDYEMQSKVVQVGASDATATSTQPVDATFACVRTITELSDGEYLVRLNIVNASNDGFVKIKESFPAGFTVEENESAGAIVTTESGSVKFVWFDAPASSSYSVAYTLKGGVGDPSISGNLSYVANNAPRELPVTGSGVIERNAPTASSSTQNTNQSNADADAAAAAAAKAEADRLAAEKAQQAQQQAQAQAQAEAAERARQAAAAAEAAKQEALAQAAREEQDRRNAAASTGTSVPNAENGVSYKVQIMAAHRVIDQKYLKSRHGFDESFAIENHEGWVKYTTGSHSVYKGARDDRERIRNRYTFKGPFVTAYNNGERITVQEALMITRQQWYK